jgi:phenol/toluene 2-monooxygenase (NADH) P0/A0
MSAAPIRHYVHVTNESRPGFVEFNYSINDPTLFLEMILPKEAFDDFCKINEVIFLSPDEVEAVEKQQKIWANEDSGELTLIHDNS